MNTYILEIGLKVGANIIVVAENKEAAIDKAKCIAIEDLESAHCDEIEIYCAEFESVNWIEEKN